MKSGDADFVFPVLGFTPDGDIWGFPDLDRLTRCGPRTLRDNSQNGMELIDAKGRCWRVTAIRRTGRAGSWLSLLWMFGPPQSRIEQDLEVRPDVSLEDVQARASAAMKLGKEDYYGKDGQAEYRSTLRKIGRARSIEKLYELLAPDTFEPH